jgi:uncharacterized membrane protein YqjE
MTEVGSEQSRARGLGGAAARLGASLLGLVRTRLELASVELAEERDRVQYHVASLVLAIAMFMFALLFTAAWIVVYFWDTNRLTAIAVVAILFAAAGAGLLMLRSRAVRAAPMPFAATIAEFERDRAALAGRDRSAEFAEPPAP